VLNSRGLRLSLSGAVLVTVSMMALLVLPGAIAGGGMLVGAMAVIGGFIWTMAEYHSAPDNDD
jgi:hypothetical protein